MIAFLQRIKRFSRALCSAWVLVLVGVLYGACGIADPSKNAQDVFTAPLSVGGVNTHTFSASKSGEFSVTVNSVSPDASTILGTAFGQILSGGCALVPGYVNGFSRLNIAALTGPIDKGNYCIQVYDPGSLTRSETYTVTVSHP